MILNKYFLKISSAAKQQKSPPPNTANKLKVTDNRITRFHGQTFRIRSNICNLAEFHFNSPIRCRRRRRRQIRRIFLLFRSISAHHMHLIGHVH